MIPASIVNYKTEAPSRGAGIVSVDRWSLRQTKDREYCLSQNLLRRQAGDDLCVCLHSFISNISARYHGDMYPFCVNIFFVFCHANAISNCVYEAFHFSLYNPLYLLAEAVLEFSLLEYSD